MGGEGLASTSVGNRNDFSLGLVLGDRNLGGDFFGGQHTVGHNSCLGNSSGVGNSWRCGGVSLGGQLPVRNNGGGGCHNVNWRLCWQFNLAVGFIVVALFLVVVVAAAKCSSRWTSHGSGSGSGRVNGCLCG
jgi:hypothetical protein